MTTLPTVYGPLLKELQKRAAAIRQPVNGVFELTERCCAGIEALIKHRIPLELKTTLTRHNIGELEAMRQMAHNWGVAFTGAWMLMRRRDGNPSKVEDCRLPAQDCVKLEATERASAEERTESAFRVPSINMNSNFNCQAGKSAFVINSSGEMNPCLSLSQPAARPLNTGFRSAWEHVQQFVDTAPPLSAACLACDARSYCPRCPAWSSMETGTLTEAVTYLCEIACKRKEHYELNRALLENPHHPDSPVSQSPL